jgi:opacity protein-like surface antigen
MKKLLFIAVLSITLFSTSCTKEYITQEYTGGNANLSTVDFSVPDSQWQIVGTEGIAGYGYVVDLNFPELTDNVIQNGMVSLYIQSDNSWMPVPIYFYNETNTLIQYQGGFFYKMQKGIFSIEYYESDGLTHSPGTQNFRLVIVQPY